MENSLKNVLAPKGQYVASIELANLTPFQRILMITDGTVTEMLEAYLLEKICVVKLKEEIGPLVYPLDDLDLSQDHPVICRQALLQGQQSQKNWVYAESIIILDRLDKEFRRKLTESSEPIGKLWGEFRTETYKEIIHSGKEPMGEVANYFESAPDELLLSRTYCVFSHKSPVMRITEKFPEKYFK